jgi:chromosome segregation ATPase
MSSPLKQSGGDHKDRLIN